MYYLAADRALLVLHLAVSLDVAGIAAAEAGFVALGTAASNRLCRLAAAAASPAGRLEVANLRETRKGAPSVSKGDEDASPSARPIIKRLRMSYEKIYFGWQ